MWCCAARSSETSIYFYKITWRRNFLRWICYLARSPEMSVYQTTRRHIPEWIVRKMFLKICRFLSRAKQWKALLSCVRCKQLNSDLGMTKETDSLFEIGLRLLVGDAVYQARRLNPYSLPTLIREVAPARIRLWHWQSWLMFCVVVLSPFKQIPIHYLELCHDHFLPHVF